LLAQLVNEAAFLIGEGNGTPEDIDAGLKLGSTIPADRSNGRVSLGWQICSRSSTRCTRNSTSPLSRGTAAAATRRTKRGAREPGGIQARFTMSDDQSQRHVPHDASLRHLVRHERGRARDNR
jgi:hypothetical protein